MNELSTVDNTAYANRLLFADNSFAYLKLDYFDTDTETWIEILDLDEESGVGWKKQSKRQKYANWGRTPLTSSIRFSIINDGSKYSDGSGEPEEGIFQLNTRVRIRGGYLIPSPEAEQDSILSTGFFYHTKFSVTE